MAYKTCIKCHASKQLTEYYKKTNRCKECAREYQKGYRIKRQTPTQKMRRYLTKSLKSGLRHRVSLNYVFEMPTEDRQKCTRCKQWKPLEQFRLEKTYRYRKGYRRTTCKDCQLAAGRKRHPPKPRYIKTEKEKKEEERIKSILTGDGCCLYCGEADFWKLNNHHPWKKMDPNFTVTLCENHHAFCTRGLLFLLEDWY